MRFVVLLVAILSLVGCSAGEGPGVQPLLVLSTDGLDPELAGVVNEAAAEWNAVCQDRVVAVTTSASARRVVAEAEVVTPGYLNALGSAGDNLKIRTGLLGDVGHEGAVSVLAHEMGHYLLGPSHNEDPEDLMFRYAQTTRVRPQNCPR